MRHHVLSAVLLTTPAAGQPPACQARANFLIPARTRPLTPAPEQPVIPAHRCCQTLLQLGPGPNKIRKSICLETDGAISVRWDGRSRADRRPNKI